MPRALPLFLLSAAAAGILLVLLGTRSAGLPPIAALLDPADGLYRTARGADASPPEQIEIPELTGAVDVRWDDRSVPHIFAENDLDGIAALGYVVARDRLFQLDFISRAASGRLSEALGGAAIPADRFLRETGMDWGARRNLERIRREGGEELAVLNAYCRGVNAYISTLQPADLPFEFRLLGHAPDRCTPIQGLRVLQYMNYDLTYRSDDFGYGYLKDRLGPDAFRLLYPDEPSYSVPILPPDPPPSTAASRGGIRATADGSISGTYSKLPFISATEPNPTHTAGSPSEPHPTHTAGSPSEPHPERKFSSISRMLEGQLPGKGSNNWAVTGGRSATGMPILAGDMHLSVTLPAIWYEVHLVTPSMNAYGVTIPGAPLPVEAFNDHLGWAFTNTGSDQIDHYRLEVDTSSLTYAYEGEERPLESVVDTIFVKGAPPIVDTLYYSHWGPVSRRAGEWIAIQWTAHEPGRTLDALLAMNQARSHEEFQAALRRWDTPMQNILYADRTGTVSIRSAGFLPVRAGGTGAGLLDGTSAAGMWIDRVPFEELPSAVNPAQGFLTSTNQKPTDSTYTHYLGHAWGQSFRSIRIDSLLRSRRAHTVGDMQAYQADVRAVQRSLFVPLLDSLSGLSPRAEAVRDVLSTWDGETALDRREPIVFHYFLELLEELAWDEEAFAAVRVGPDGDTLANPVGLPRPENTRLHHLLSERRTSDWLDIRSTPTRETARDLLAAALDSAAVLLEQRYGPHGEAWTWSRRHKIRFDHLLAALVPAGRGPFAYPGYDETLSPASDTLATHSASWRVVVDFSGPQPHGLGVYPGGQSGNPFSRYYDLHLPTYLAFDYYELLRPGAPSELDRNRIRFGSVLRPVSD